jgi:hypothetical protein
MATGGANNPGRPAPRLRAARRRSSRRNLVVLRALGLGDLLAGVPALRALARAFPEHRRRLAAPAALAPLLPLIREAGEPCVESPVDFAGLDDDPALLPRQPEVAIDLHGRGPQSHRVLLASDPLSLIAFGNERVPGTEAMPVWRADEHEVARWCRLLRESGIDADPTELEIVPPAVVESAAETVAVLDGPEVAEPDRPTTAPGEWTGAELDGMSPAVGLPAWARGSTILHPGAASAARRWPVERWAAVARSEIDAGREVLVTGSSAEAPIAAALAAAVGLPPSRILAGGTELLALAGLVSVAGTVVCGDTGVGHLATALGTPSVLLFGPTSPAHWGPPPERQRHRGLWNGEVGDPHGDEVDPGLLAIEPATVITVLDSLRATAPVRSRPTLDGLSR